MSDSETFPASIAVPSRPPAELPAHRLYRDVSYGQVNGGPAWVVWGDGRPIAQFLRARDADLFCNALRWKAAVLDGDPSPEMRMPMPL